MREPKFTKCRECGAKIGKQNTSGYCHPCAMKENGKRRSEENASYQKIVLACREAGYDVAEKVRQFLDEQRRESEASLAEICGERVIAKLPPNLQQFDIERLWRFEEYVVSLPTIAVEIKHGLLNLAYRNHTGQNHSAEDIRRHFESAVHRQHPDIQVEWVAELHPEKPNQETA